ncbi:MAG: LemA family protein, partial [Eubacterium sp.]|nr:LemA family protein [Eubacterium sp.]
NFMQLSSELSQVETDIANARKYYNGCVKVYNIACQAFPSGMIAGMFHFEKATMYEVSDASERENVKVSF